MASTDQISPGIDLKQLRNALGAFATGVTIITTCDGEEDVGLTASSFNSVSLNPPMVLWSLGKSSMSLPFFERSSHFAVHVLAEDQEDLSKRFATRGGDKFSQLSIMRGENGLPLLSDCSARFQCRKVFEYEGGDHIIFVGEVLAFDHASKRPLLFHGGSYAVPTPREVSQVLESLGAAEDSLSYLVARAHMAVRGASLNYAEQLGLGLPERYLLSLLLDRGGRGIDEVNDIIGYSGLTVTEETVDRLHERGLITVMGASISPGALSLTAAGRALVIAMIAITRAQDADAEIQLGPQCAVLKQLLTQLASVSGASADPRIFRHMEVIAEVVKPG